MITLLLWLPLFGCGSGRDKASPLQPESEESGAPQTQAGETEKQSTAKSTPDAKLDRDVEIAAAERLLEQDQIEAAESRLRALLVLDPGDVEVLFRLATINAFRGDLAAAVELLDAIPPEHPDAGVPALGQSADWCVDLGRYDEAEQRFRRILALFPQVPEVHRKLARLLNRQGRRHEAAGHIYQLCQQGNVRQDELHALVHLSDAMIDDPSTQASAGSEVSYAPIGVSAEARKLFMEDKYQEAVNVLADSVRAGDEPPSIVAFFGRAAAEAQDSEQLGWWLKQPDKSGEFAESWAALGLFLISQQRYEEAVRALLEAIDRDPTDFRSISRIRSALESLGRQDDAIRWEERFSQLTAVSVLNNRVASAETPHVASMVRLSELLDSLDRKLEAVLWKSIAALHQQLPREAIQQLQGELKQVVESGRAFPDRTSRLCGLDPSKFPMPNIDASAYAALPKSSAPRQSSPHPARFRNVASDFGLQHAYQVASTTVDKGFSVYQSIGGAVAVIDYDLDGQPDLYFCQGAADPPEFIGDRTNLLYRHVGDRFSDVTGVADASEYRYSTGVTRGDWNQDGFPDLVVGNIGANTLLLNNGDGTFTRTTLDDRDDKSLLTTSLAMGDVNGDSLPDLFELNYLHDPDISRRPRTNDAGEVIESLMPQEFIPGLDRLFVRDAAGQATPQSMGDPESAARAGLGVVMTDLDHEPGNEVFVGNDVYANQLWVRGDDGGWSDVAMLRGCAYGFNGAKTASMGIASGDFDRNGWIDFHITNFQDESVSLYLNRGGSFQDRNVQFGLGEVTKSVLGFGSQAIDYDNDADLDLVVANGHIENAVTINAPFEQPAQLFCNLGNRFELVKVSDESGYFDQDHLGRGLARLDVNRDGFMDVAVTHLGEPSALLLNETAAPQNHWIQLRFCGVDSERDAIGTRVTIRMGEVTLTDWVIGGDGFLCRNESIVAFGLGGAERVDEISVTWPSGRQQIFRDVDVDRRLMIIENQPEPFVL